MTVTSATWSAVMVAGLPSIAVVTVTEADEPSVGSVTVHLVPTGRSSMVVAVSPAGAFAGISMSRLNPLSQRHVQADRPLVAGRRPGDRLRHPQRRQGRLVGVGDGDVGDLVGGDGGRAAVDCGGHGHRSR